MEKKESETIDPPNKKGAKVVFGCLGLILICMVFFIFLSNIGEDDSVEEPEIKKFTKLEAKVMSEIFVKNNLKSPGSAEFEYSEDQVTKLNDSTFEIRSYVDSQNSFGALLRMDYFCKLYFDQNEKAYLMELEMK